MGVENLLTNPLCVLLPQRWSSRRRWLCPPVSNSVPLTSCALSLTVPGQPGGMVVGAYGSVRLDARFDAGYFCTVNIGRHEFRGATARSVPA